MTVTRLSKSAPWRRVVAVLAAASAALASSAAAQTTVSGAGGVYGVKVVSFRDLPFRSVVRQQYDFSCGSAALATLLRHHFGQVDVDEAKVFKGMYAHGDPAKIRARGFSLLDMKRFAEAQGFRADGYRLSLDQLTSAGRPAIVMVTHGPWRHFVVVKGARPGQVLVGDPARGIGVYDAAAFAKAWNGVALLVEDADGRRGAFDAPADWRFRPATPYGEPMNAGSLSGFVRELPPLYQISPPAPVPAL